MPSPRRDRPTQVNNMLLITHDGTFHADDVLAYVILSATFPSARLVRTRKEEVINGTQDAIVFDVGAAYDPISRRYDHHMRDKPLREDGTPYSSVGLVWRHHGREFLSSRYSGESDTVLINSLWQRIDQDVIRFIDMADNGYGQISPDGMPTLIDAFNANWDEKRPVLADSRFLEAAQFASLAFNRIADKALAAEKAVTLVTEAALSAADPRVVVLPRSMPWEGTLTAGGFEEALYVVYPNGDGAFFCVAVPPERGSFAQRLPLPAEWAGLRGESLTEVSGVPDATFCHPGRFICGASSLDGAMSLAHAALAAATPRPSFP